MLKKFLSLTFSGLFISSLAFCQYNQWKTLFSPYLVNTLTKYQNTIFLGTKSGLVSFEETKPESAVYFSEENGLSSVDISCLLIDSVRNQLIIGFENGDLQFMNLETSAFTSIPDIKLSTNYTDKSINSLHILKNKLWIGTSFGIVGYDLIKKASGLNGFDFTVTKILTYSNLNIKKIIFQNDTVFVASSESVFKSPLNNLNFNNPDSWKREALSNSGAVISDLIFFNGNFYAASNKGVFRRNGNNYSPTQLINSAIKFWALPEKLLVLNDSIYTLNGSQKQYHSGSLDQLDKNGNRSRLASSLQLVTDVSESNGKILISTAADGIMEIENGEKGFLIFDGLYLNSFPGFSLGPNKKFIGNGGLRGDGNDFSSYFDGKNHHIIKSSAIPGVGSGIVQNSSAFVGDDLYIGTFGRGILKVTGDSIQIINNTNSDLLGISGNPDFIPITDILHDDNGDIWVISYGSSDNKPLKVKRKNKSWQEMDSYGYQNYLFGIHKIDGQNFHWLGLLNSSDGTKVSFLVFSDNNTPSVTSDDKSVILSTSNGLPSNDINDVVFDKNGAAWIATSSGLSVIYNAQYIFSGTVSVTPVYSVENEKVNSLVIDATGKVWAATPQGILVINSETQKIESSLTTINSGLVDNNVTKLIYQAETGLIYALTNYGISYIKTTAVQTGNQTQTPKIFPNPFLIEKNSGVWIEGLSKESKVVILSADGSVVNILNSTQSLVAFWDGTNKHKEKVGSGIYFIYLLDKENNSASIGKVAVIR